MNKKEALSFIEKISNICKDTDGVWHYKHEEHTPELKILKLEISIKIDK